MENQNDLNELKKEMHKKQREAENAAYAYAIACEIGDERTRAFQIYENIRLSILIES